LRKPTDFGEKRSDVSKDKEHPARYASLPGVLPDIFSLNISDDNLPSQE
jgi:hypothetical protein